MNSNLKQILIDTMQAKDAELLESIQELWSGYGEILRVRLEGAREKTVVVKWIRFPNQINHPRGWHSNLSHDRKVQSYEVEKYFYANYASTCANPARLAHCFNYGFLEQGEQYIILEDLDAKGFPERKYQLDEKDIQACISWLAHFHATFLEVPPKGLWESGTYWHLQTRPDELEALDDIELKESAHAIDQALSSCPLRSFVHGDAKVANFCFPKQGEAVAAVDFQYVGGGCGMKDLAYFLGSCLTEKECEKNNERYLNQYFGLLNEALVKVAKSNLYRQVEELWRPLFPYAWADFHRFIKGWSPGHWKINSYSERVTRQVCESVKS